MGHNKVGTQEGMTAVGMGLFEHSEGAKPALPCDLGKPRGPSRSGYCPAGMGMRFPVLRGHRKAENPAVTDVTADTLVLQLLAIKPHHFHTAAKDKPCISVLRFPHSLCYFQT